MAGAAVITQIQGGPVQPQLQTQADGTPQAQKGRGEGEAQNQAKSATHGAKKASASAVGGAGGGVNTPVNVQETVASVNAGAAIAGLKPWSREWVFEGGIQNDPEMKPLLNPAEKVIPTELRGNSVIPLFPNMPSQTRGDAETATGELENSLSSMSESLKKLLNEAGATVETVAGHESANAKPMQVGAGGTGSLGGAEFVQLLNGAGAARGQTAGGDSRGSESGQRGQKQAQAEGVSSKKAGIQQPSLSDSFAAVRPARIKGAGLEMGNPREMHLGMGAVAKMGQDSIATPLKPEMTAHVVPGSMARERLTSDALAGIGGNIRNLTAQGGGEMRIRLKPENLGELHVRVVTSGKDVGLQIQASDEGARRVIEESMSYLRDSLATQNLSLGSVDVTVAKAESSFGAGNNGNEKNQASHQNGSQSFADSMGQNGRQGSQWNERGEATGNSVGPTRATSLRSQVGRGFDGGTTASRAAADGRIDVRA